MILSKQNLIPINISKPDKNIPVLDNLLIEGNGNTIAGNGKSFIVVSSVNNDTKLKMKKIYENDQINFDQISLSSETTKEILKNISSDLKYGGILENISIKKIDKENAKIEIYDGARKKEMTVKNNPMKYPPYKKIFERALNSKNENIRIVLNVKRFLSLIETIIKCSSDSSDFSPLFLEFTNENDIIVRMMNPKTGQKIIGIMQSNKLSDGKWLEEDSFENELKNISSDESKNISSDESKNISSKITKKKKAKKTGNKQLSTIINKICPECNKCHLATDGTSEWCSCRSGCNYYRKVK